MKALEGAFNQEKALVGAFSVIVKTGCGTDGSFYSTGGEGESPDQGPSCASWKVSKTSRWNHLSGV